MTLNVRTGRAVLARPIIDKGGEMGNKAKEKSPARPERLKRIRVCGKWQKPGYKPDDEEIAAWEKRCKDRGWDRKTGKPKVANMAPIKETKK
jgi:hypothetical protein